jgi:hypothetical protein
LSVEAGHDKLICDDDTAVAVRLTGADGGVVSGVPLTAVVMSAWISATLSARL